MPAFVAVGIDSSDTHHDIHAEAAGVGPDLRLRVSNDLAGFQTLLDALRKAFGELPCAFAVENPESLLSRFLIHAGERVYPVNPRSVAEMRKAVASSGKKDDPIDAHSLCFLIRLRREELSPVQLGSEPSQVITGLVRQRTDVVEEKTRVLNQLTAVLKGFYPRALELFSDLEQPLALAFLARFGTPHALAAATQEQWEALFAGKRYPRPDLIKSRWETARQPQVPVPPAVETLSAREVQRLVRTLELQLRELQDLETELKAQFDALPDAKTFRSLPGSGAALAPALFSLFGDDRERWSQAEDITRLTGAVPITVQSGKSRVIQMRRHCDRHARRILHLFAGCSRRSCAWANSFYLEQRRRGKSNATALRNLATKWLRILFRLWKDRAVYDEATYLQGRTARQGPKTPGPRPA